MARRVSRRRLIGGLGSATVAVAGQSGQAIQAGQGRAALRELPPRDRSLLATSLPSRGETVARFAGQEPAWFGMEGPEVVSTFTSAEEVVLTFDACGGHDLQVDAALLEVLRRRRTPATLFVNRTWALANWRVFTHLRDDPLFEIANHGDLHVPLSVAGRSAYGIPGTRDVGGVYDEVAGAHRLFRRLWGFEPRWFRPGTAHVDDVSARVAAHLGTPVVGCSVNGDHGGTASAAQVAGNLGLLAPGGILLAHMNRPGSGTAAGVDAGLDALAAAGLRPRRLGDVL